MPLSALVQTPKFTTVAVVRAHITSKRNSQVCTHGFHSRGSASPYQSTRRRLHTVGDVTSKPCLTRFHHHLVNDRQQMRFLKGFKVCQRGVHNRYAPEIEELYKGNKAYIANMSETNPGLLQSLADNGQKPPFMLVDCSDSRVNEQGIFSAEPGTIFTAGNIANQFDEEDLNSNAVLSYAVETLKVKHVIVMGHYGCGGIAASMVPPPVHEGPIPRSADVAVQSWISPIRYIYQTSKRSEIVAHRMKYAKTSQEQNLPHLHDPAFRALVEENVKANVIKIARSSVMQEHYASPESEPITEVYIHGWVYDVESGEVSDLGVSVGPPGKVVPPSPFPTIKPSDRKKELGNWSIKVGI